MSGIFAVLGEAQTGLYRLKQMSKYDDGLGGPKTVQQQLAQKQGAAGSGVRMAPKDIRGAQAAMTAMEEARRIASPKANAEQRLAEVERRIEEIRAEMRMAAASGDREKMIALAREAAQLAREAGRAAKTYAGGVSSAADIGVSGTIGTGSSATMPEESLAAAAAGEQAGAGGPAGMPSPVALPSAAASAPAGNVDQAPNPFQRMAGGNDLRFAGYKEADAFGQRVERVLGHVKSVLGEAKAANEGDLDEARRRERRKELKEYDKIVAGAEDEVDTLRGVALQSSLSMPDAMGAAVDASAGAGEGGGPAPASGLAGAPAVDVVV